MPVDQSAASRYDQNASGTAWASSIDGTAWSQGVQDGDIEGGLSDAGVANVEGSGLQEKWEQNVADKEDDYEQNARAAQSDYENNTNGNDWLDAMSDASNWNI